MGKNCIREVANIFGKKLGEEFYVRRNNSEPIYKVQFTKHGLRSKVFEYENDWAFDDILMTSLIIGVADIIKEKI